MCEVQKIANVAKEARRFLYLVIFIPPTIESEKLRELFKQGIRKRDTPLR